ncbi:hypothetical protein FPZ12_015160 [Amycolatopsis acidicola]|uniref:Pentapeptide repeat-containing protein n=1 Tax=Amycolatopsis acidicola TaxID=2596893 RepID=A0A5N0V3U2_9PSEU|nr:pentapeptide repeat-containing protein [Amycolatopsis acidicola]KAA9161097.1 hypothetical protein FPZ12_015160 [Amycolatopsis acidicola]
MTGRPSWKSPLLGTFVLSVLLLVGVSGWLLTDPATTRADALRTGGLAAGAVVALYALWLNDRRRKVEEGRQRTERERYELEALRAERDRSRVVDERFAKAIELLGSEADQVRVGAMHALAGVARSEPEYTQTVLDVLCSYLRRPFENPHLHEESDPEAERELTVRLTAQRLIGDLLTTVDSPGPGYDLDLTGASLEYFELTDRKIGTLIMRYATLLSSANLSRSRFTGPAWFTKAVVGTGRKRGRFRCQGTVFEERAWFSGTEFGSLADFTGTEFRGEVSFGKAVFAGYVDLRADFGATLDFAKATFGEHADLRVTRMPKSVAFYNTFVDPKREYQLPPEWELATVDGRVRLNAAEG